ncbi:MAG: hypothetical protein ACTSO9_09670 [Candidatus Helarchaeota archaeon]
MKIKYYNPPKGLIITPSGMRGEVGSILTSESVLRFSKSFGLWLGNGSSVLIGRDTRNTGFMLSNIVASGLMDVGVNVLDSGICPTPCILYYKRQFGLDGAAIISGSHNPPKDNGIKFLSRTHTFLGNEELDEINQYFLYSKDLKGKKWNKIGNYKQVDIINPYIKGLKKNLDIDIFKKKNKKLTVVVDPGAGAGVGVTDRILKELGCKVILINDKFRNYPNFPREIEPVKKNLSDLSSKVVEVGANIGIAHDCDADRIGISDSKGRIYPEDITVILLIKYILEKHAESLKDNEKTKKSKTILVTNSASTLNFEQIAMEFGAEVLRTPVGERYLAIKMDELIKEHPDYLIFGGEGSSGGFMYPKFNNARDGIFAACLLCQLILDREEPLKELIEKLPKLYTMRKLMKLEDFSLKITVEELMQKLKAYLENEEVPFETYINDIRTVDYNNLEWMLIHPSNTEPLIRVICEAKTIERAMELCEEGVSLLKKQIE